MRISIGEAKKRLSKLIKSVEEGGSVTICRRGVPAVDIVKTKAISAKKRVLGSLRGKIKIIDPDWWKPMTDEEVEAFLEGRY